MASKGRGKVCPCGKALYNENHTGYCRKCWDGRFPSTPPTEPAQAIDQDREKRKERSQLADYKQKYAEALKTIEALDSKLANIDTIAHEGINTFTIEPKVSSGTSEGTVVAVASDWHIEENVGPEVGTLNRYNIEIAHQRATRFFQTVLRLTNLLAQDITINQIVLALLGDFITNDIHHGEQAEMNEQQPIHALVTAQNMIASGIQFILDNSKYSLVIPCHSGNHARTTAKTRFAAENGHSLEYLMYCHLAAYFRHEPRVTFIIPEGYHSYVRVYDQVIRFHHGHAIRYAGGVGGLYIPAGKALAQWDRGIKSDLDVFGHLHQLVDGGRFICNGSMIGYNAFALSIKAAYEPPKQALFLMDSKRGRTCLWPILFGDY